MFLNRNKKKNVYPCKPQFYYINVGFKRVKIILACFRDAVFWLQIAIGLFMPPTSKKFEGHIASGLFVRPSVRPFVTLFDAWHNLRTVTATVLKFLGFLMKKKADTCSFSWQDYPPFLSYGPLKKYGCNLVSKISQKLLKLEPWNLMNRLVVMTRQPDLLLRKFWKNTSWVMALCNFGHFYLVSKISQKLFELQPWNLANRFVVMSRWPD